MFREAQFFKSVYRILKDWNLDFLFSTNISTSYLILHFKLPKPGRRKLTVNYSVSCLRFHSNSSLYEKKHNLLSDGYGNLKCL